MSFLPNLRRQGNYMFCEFIEIEYRLYKCKKCGTTLLSHDGMPPIFICNKELSPNKIEMPSFIEKIKNFSKASANHIISGMKLATDETIKNRYNICQNCEFFKNETCSKCGCPLFSYKKYISKLSWSDQECPVGKWNKETT